MKLSNKLRSADGGNGRKLLMFRCPGCNELHGVTIENPNNLSDCWIFDGNVEKPTFAPSILVRSGHYLDSVPNTDCWCTYNRDHPDAPVPYKCSRCHSYVSEGRIQFLDDCSHELVGLTVDLPDLSEPNED